MTTRERGNATLELTLGVALLVVPITLVAAMLPSWLERHAVATLAAREAARAFVLADTPAAAAADAQAVARTIGEGHGLGPGELDVRLSGALSRGATVTATARVRVPAVALPGVGQVGGFTVTATHEERIDRYRSW